MSFNKKLYNDKSSKEISLFEQTNEITNSTIEIINEFSAYKQQFKQLNEDESSCYDLCDDVEEKKQNLLEMLKNSKNKFDEVNSQQKTEKLRLEQQINKLVEEKNNLSYLVNMLEERVSCMENNVGKTILK